MKISNKILLFYVIFIAIMTTTVHEVLAGEDLLFEKTLQTSPGKTLDVDALAGNVTLTAGTTDQFTLKVYGNDEAKEKLEYSAENTSQGIGVEIKKKSSGNFRNLNLRLEIQVPSEYNLNLKTGGGNITITSVKGKIELTSSGGNISLDGSSGDISVSTQGGNLNLKSFDGNVSAETNGGNIKLSGSNGSVFASTNGGNVTLDYTGKNYGIELVTNAGNVKIDVPSDIDADVDMSTTVGRIITDFGTPTDKHIGSSLKTTLGSGGNKLKCSTNAGTITANKK